MGGNKVAPPRKGMAAGGTGKTYVGKPGGGASNGAGSGYGPPAGAKKVGGMGGGGGASTAEIK